MNTVKNITEKDIFDLIRSAVNRAVDFIKPTFGPAGKKVIISKLTHRMVVDDGVQIARDLELEDKDEQAVWLAAKEVAIRTNDRVGDGTTGSLIMLQSIVNEAGKKTSPDGRATEKELRKGLDDAKKQLLDMAKPIKTLAELEAVARISFDDQKVSKVIAKAWHDLGPDGVLTVDRSGTMETVADVTAGVKIPRGYVSPYMVTNAQRMESVIEKPYILLTDYRLTEATDVIGIMNTLVQKQIFSLVIVCESIEGSALATLIVNRQNPNGPSMNILAVCAPGSGEERTVFMEDLAIMTGARFFSEKKGDKLEETKLEDLGRAQRFIARRDVSIIVDPKGQKSKVKEAIEAITKSAEKLTDENQKKAARERAARFAGKIAVVKVGAATEGEEKALRYKVEDCVNAVHAAYKGGVVPGAGIALASLKTSSPTLNAALKAPHAQLLKSCGLEHTELGKGEAVNVVTGRTGNFMDVGVCDPVDVLIAGIESAVSIASVLLTSCGAVIETPPKPKTE